MIAVAGISRLVVMIFPVDTSIRSILHPVQTGSFSGVQSAVGPHPAFGGLDAPLFVP
jgi:hypothetical protein